MTPTTIASSLDHLPVGFRFRPTDEELVNHYLTKKLQGDDFTVRIIPNIDLCKVEPWDMPALSVIQSDDPEWFFFSPRDYKYAKSTRSNRATKHGFWKTTGQDRKIKVRGTNNVIGSKKTLVFYEGRVPHGVKTNWVIHEYHATTFDVSQRTYVLCRLMKKAETKAEAERVPINFYEGEPSSHMAIDYEDQETAEIIPNVRRSIPSSELQPPPLLHSPIGLEQQESFPNSPSFNAYARNVDGSMHYPFETTEEEDDADKFFHSIWVDGDVHISEERVAHAFVNGPNQSESLRKVYHEGSDTDAEVVYAQCANNIFSISLECDEHASSRDCYVSEKVQSSHVFPCQSSTARDDIWGVESSSCDSTADKPLEINSLEISSSPPTSRRLKNQYHSRPDSLFSQRAAARRHQAQRKVPSSAVSHLEDKKELVIVESEKDKEKAQNNSSRKNFGTRSCQQSGNVKGKGYFIFTETPSSSQSLYPPSVYLANVIIGIFLFIVITWEVLLC